MVVRAGKRTRLRARALEIAGRQTRLCRRPRSSRVSARGSTLPALEELAARIRANPHAYVGQERVALSTAPVWNGEALEPRPLILRCYICATADGYAVMPGGLTRVSASADSPIVSSRYGGGSKDTWVRSDRAGRSRRRCSIPVRRSLAPSAVRAQVPEPRGGKSFLARPLRRAARRHDAPAARPRSGRLAGEGGPTEEEELAALARWLVARDKLPPRFADASPLANSRARMRELVFERNRPGNVRELLAPRSASSPPACATASPATPGAFSISSRRSFPQHVARQQSGAILTGTLHRLIFQLAAFSGMEMENMTRGHAWRFLDIGRRLERAINLLTNVRAALAAEPLGGAALAPLLEYTDSTMTYRRRYLALPELPRTLDLLLGDSSNPRALAFQIEILNTHITKLPNTHADLPERRRVSELVDMLGSVDFISLGGDALAGQPEPLDAWLRDFLQGCWALSDMLTAQHFSHVLARSS